MSILFNREDWKLFRTIDTLCQKAGVSRNMLPRLVVKELVDNALDICDWCEVDFYGDDQEIIYVQDNGQGIDPKLLPQLFCINRPMISSKLLRLPTRGALGNGLRVVMGAVVASGGWIRIGTRGHMYEVISNDVDGSSQIIKRGAYGAKGTRIEINLGSLREYIDKQTLVWGRNAIILNQGAKYEGKTSAYWYTSEAFFEMLNASNASVSDLLRYMDVKANVVKMVAEKFGQRKTNDLFFDEADQLLGTLRNNSKFIPAKQIGAVGNNISGSFASKSGYFTLRGARGKYHAEIPVTVEMWARKEEGRSIHNVYVNKTPIVSDTRVNVSAGKVSFWGNGFDVYSNKTKAKNVFLTMNIMTPYMPITSDGKAPNFAPMASLIEEVMTKAVTQMSKELKTEAILQATAAVLDDDEGAKVIDMSRIKNEKDVLFTFLPTAVIDVSENGRYMFSLRQLYYALRPKVIEILEKEPDYNYFGRCITEWEATRGDIAGLYRDPRGTLYTPHSKQEIPIGTLSVARYKRPEWTFNRILYSEKEGLFPALKQVDFPERYDCALLSSKGYASRAVRDLLDMLGEDGEDIEFFCIHDGDNAGTMIYETLQEETKARKGRKVKIINLGLEPWEGVEMGLQVEDITGSDRKRRPTAQYVKEQWGGGTKYVDWDDWLQNHRIELNAMSPALFIAWLEKKFTEYNNGKLVPPESVLRNRLEQDSRNLVENIIREKILAEAGFLDQVDEAYAAVQDEITSRLDLVETVRADLLARRVRQWIAPVNDIASEIVGRLIQ